MYVVAPSAIHGRGIIALKVYRPGELIDKAISGWLYILGVPTRFGSLINHSRFPSARLCKINGDYYTQAIHWINPMDEITVDYDKCPWFIKGSKVEWNV